MLKKRALNRIFFVTISVFIVMVFLSLNLINSKNKTYPFDNYTTSFKENIYTLNNDNYISKLYIYVNKEMNTLEKVKLLLETMIEKNNKNVLLPSYFKPILPQNTKVLDVYMENKLIKINFSEEFFNVSEEQSEKMIEAITYTLTDLDDINGVEIYVNNDLLKYIPHTKKEIPTILTKDFGINKKYEITSTTNINKVVLYFLGSNNNYIPVTKYLNDEREKIEIIIEELANNYIYYDNLSSVLNNKLELHDYEINDKTLTLMFNDSSNNEFTSIIYSIFDNYDIENVIIMNNNKKILEKNKKNLE